MGLMDYSIVTGIYSQTYGVWYDDGTLERRDIFLYQRYNRNIKIDVINGGWNYSDRRLEEIINAF